MQIILKYSPFRCIKDFFYQFDRIKGESGTLVIIYNMKLLDNGSAELDITTDARDILLAASSDKDDLMEPHADIELPPEKRSLRAYVSILYADPRMKVHIQCRKVQTKRLLDTLYAVKRYNFASKTFRTRAERDLAKAKNDVKVG
uniref:Arp2/3 complex 34 kDa subunit n=1 Tax=Mesocestoides corti TaxID=53468 RepID=A0A5K3FXE2_MESCO